MPEAAGVFGAGSTAEQLFVWQVVAQVVAALLAPAFSEVQNISESTFQNTKISAPDAAKAVVRSYLSDAAGLAEAQSSGINAARFAVLRDLAGVAPGPQQLAEALRRQAIPESGSGPDSISFEQGIRETDLLDKWTPVIKAISLLWPSPADVIDGVVKGQVSPAEGQATFAEVGGDPRWYQLLVNIAGNPPSPTELLELAKRGIIPWSGTGPDATTFQQGFFEGRSKDKWEPVYRHLQDYYPTASEVVELYRWGVIDVPTATTMLVQRGLTAEQSQWWIEYANANAIDDYRGLTEQAILAMLSVSFITDDQARTMLAAIHKGPLAIEELISYGHIQRAIQSINQAVSRVGNLYQSRKITAQTASQSLAQLKVDPSAIPEIIADWDAVASINVRTLTEAQIVDAWSGKIMDYPTALQELQNIGYTPYDAWVLLSIKNKSPLPDQPEPGPGAPLGAVAPGTT